MTAYVIYQANILDPDRYEHYKEKAAPNLVQAGGRFVVRGGQFEVFEGKPPPQRTTIIAFATREAARAWYFSEDYAEIRRLREGASESRMYVVDGVE